MPGTSALRKKRKEALAKARTSRWKDREQQEDHSRRTPTSSPSSTMTSPRLSSAKRKTLHTRSSAEQFKPLPEESLKPQSHREMIVFFSATRAAGISKGSIYSAYDGWRNEKMSSGTHTKPNWVLPHPHMTTVQKTLQNNEKKARLWSSCGDDGVQPWLRHQQSPSLPRLAIHIHSWQGPQEEGQQDGQASEEKDEE